MSVGEASIGLNLGTAQLDSDTKVAERLLNRISRGVIENGKQAEKAIDQLSAAGVTSVDRLQRAFNTLNIKAGMDIENEKRKITAAFEQIKNSGVASAKEIERAHEAMKSKISGLDAPIKNAAGMFTGLGSAAMTAMAGFSLTAVITQLHAAGMAAERLRNSFEAATGSMAKGAAEFGFARAESQRLGLDLQTTADAYLKLTASARGTTLEGQKTRDIFSAVSGAGRALGLSGDQMGGALLAISQMMSKGTVQAEELRGQLGERLPGAFNIAARAMKVSTAELGKMLEGGKVISEDFLPLFAAELIKTFPAGEKAMNGMTAETMRLKTAWYELKTTVMEGGGESMFTNAIKGMKDMVVEADTFYGRMSGAWQLLKDFAKNPMNPNLGGAPNVAKLPPLTAFDNALTGVPATGTGIGALVERGRAGTLKPTMLIDAEARNAQEEEMKAAKKHGAKPTDPLLKQILSYQSDMAKLMDVQEKSFYEVGQDIERSSSASAAAFKINTMQTGDLKTDRYKATPLSKYRLRTNDQYSIPSQIKPISPEQATINKDKVDALNASMSGNIKHSNGDAYGAAKDSLLEKHSERLRQIDEYQKKEVMTVEQADAAKLKSNEEYAAAKAKLDEDTAKQALNSLGDSLASLGDTMMQGGKESFEAGKKLAIAGATIQMISGSIAAFSTAMTLGPIIGPIIGGVSAAAVIAAGTMNIAKISSTQYPGRALGGPVTAGQTYIVNENRATQGPEYFTPGVSGTITPANKIGGGQAISMTQVLQISTGVADTVRAEIGRLMPLLRQQAVQAVQQASRSGQMQGA